MTQETDAYGSLGRRRIRSGRILRVWFVPLLASVCFLLVGVVVCGKDYYRILGVARDAEPSQIRSAFKKLSLKYHPDKNPGSTTAEGKFQEISAAYEVLMDDEKRKLYDRFGEDGLKNGGQRRHDNPFDMHSWHSNFGHNFHGGFHNHHHGHRHEEEHKGAEDITQTLTIDLETVYRGGAHKFLLNRRVVCPTCQGSGTQNKKDVQKCHVCHGQGHRIVQKHLAPGFVQQFRTTCDVCGGSGKVYKSKCNVCEAEKIIEKKEEIKITVEPGFPEGYKIIMSGKGNEAPDRTPGNLNLVLQSSPHPRFERQGNNLRYQMKINLLEALNGFTRKIKHLDGNKITVESHKVIFPGETMVFKGKGLPVHKNARKYGDLYVSFDIEFPEALTDTQKQILKKALHH